MYPKKSQAIKIYAGRVQELPGDHLGIQDSQIATSTGGTSVSAKSLSFVDIEVVELESSPRNWGPEKPDCFPHKTIKIMDKRLVIHVCQTNNIANTHHLHITKKLWFVNNDTNYDAGWVRINTKHTFAFEFL